MDIRNRQTLKQDAADALAAASYSPTRLIFLHTGATLALTLVLMALSYYLDTRIAHTGGLSSLGTRSVLQTIQALLQLVAATLTPFWSIGYVYASLRLIRREPATPATLLEGFRRFFPVLRLMLLQMLIFFGVAVVCIQLAMVIFLATPWAQPLYEIAQQMLADPTLSDPSSLLSQSQMLQIGSACSALFLLFYALLALPLFYRYRMAQLALMDHPEQGALYAMRTSRLMMRGNCLPLLRLDLSFWWFYSLDVLLLVLNYGDQLLQTAGIPLPISTPAAYFLFSVASGVLQLGLYVWARNRVQLTYAAAYETLRQISPPADVPQSPRRMPWQQ